MPQPIETQLSPEEYLAIERQAEERSEYYRGEMFLLAGASRQHNRIATNLTSLLDRQLAGRDCDVYASDLRVLVDRTGLYTYPDLVVTCGPERFADEHRDVLLNPLLIIEILSASTEAHDRGRKFEHYQQIESLTEYLLVAQDSMRVEQYRKQESEWLYREVRGGERVVELPVIDGKLPMSEIYRRAEPGASRRLR
ncbi:MAG: Uma2 family endonuclease [Acidobacteriota bacterium]